MTKMILICIALVLSACTTTQSTQVGYVQSCAAYGVAFNTALNLRLAGKLNKAQIDAVTAIDSQITPICTGPLPVDAKSATLQVTSAVTNLALIGAAK